MKDRKANRRNNNSFINIPLQISDSILVNNIFFEQTGKYFLASHYNTKPYNTISRTDKYCESMRGSGKNRLDKFAYMFI